MRYHYHPHITRLWRDAARFDDVERIPPDAEAVQFRREKKSHRGISRFSGLRGLSAEATDQDFLEEICQLSQLEYLELAWPTTAKDLTPLIQLERLKFLRIDSPRNIEDFTPLLRLPQLEALIIENAKHLTTLDWLKPMASQLKVLGIEGSMNTDQRIESLAPLAEFELEALLLVSTRLEDQDLTPLHGMASLRLLETALNAPRREFEALHAARPELVCSWFHAEKWNGFRDPRPPKAKV
ncbi:MAG: hypothetical protein AAF251_12700 [Pseudomonadota bacterium]